jgi:RimJ/RimL family protein N-acetyltransferase
LPYRRAFVPLYHTWMADPYLLETTASERLTEAEEYEAQRSWVTDPLKCTFIVFDHAAHLAGCGSGGAGAPALGVGTQGMLGDTNLFLLDAASVASDYFGGVACSGGAAEVMVMVAEPAYRRRGYAQRAVQALLWYGATALRLRRFVAKVSEDNAPSLALFTVKLGFTVAKRVAAFKEVHLVLEVGEPAEGAAQDFTLTPCPPTAEEEAAL